MRYTSIRLVSSLVVMLAVLFVLSAFDLLYTNQFSQVSVHIVQADSTINRKPVAHFTTNKSSYAMGEPIIYTNLSYDLDAEQLEFSWKGKADTFFEAGAYTITLIATDPQGVQSEPFIKVITVTEQSFLDEISYHAYYGNIGDSVILTEEAVDKAFSSSEMVHINAASYSDERTLIMSDSPEQITKPGLLYQESINGKARLYLNHVNEMRKLIDVAIILENKLDEPVHLATTASGHLDPAKYAMLLGHVATSQLLLDDKRYPLITLLPGQQYVYEQFTEMKPQDVAHSIFDVESTGQLEVSFIALGNMQKFPSFQWTPLPFNGHLRGTYPASERTITVELQAAELGKIQHLYIGDGMYDKLQLGYDSQSAIKRVLTGNFGVTYQVTIHNAERYTLFFVARGGAYKGSLLVNGTYVPVPQNGIVQPKNSVVKVAQTTDDQHELKLEFIVPAGSSLPFILYFYPI